MTIVIYWLNYIESKVFAYLPETPWNPLKNPWGYPRANCENHSSQNLKREPVCKGRSVYVHAILKPFHLGHVRSCLTISLNLQSLCNNKLGCMTKHIYIKALTRYFLHIIPNIFHGSKALSVSIPWTAAESATVNCCQCLLSQGSNLWQYEVVVEHCRWLCECVFVRKKCLGEYLQQICLLSHEDVPDLLWHF